MKKAVVFWILTFMIMALLFYFSSQTAVESTKVSAGLIESITRAFLSITKMTETEIADAVQKLDGPVRVLAHYSIFAVLGVVCYLAAYFTKDLRHIYKSMYSVGICTAYALFDEAHQIFVTGRTFQVSDIITDTAGIITGTLIVIGIILLHRKKVKQ